MFVPMAAARAARRWPQAPRLHGGSAMNAAPRRHWHASQALRDAPRRASPETPLPEDPTPYGWQRAAQLLAGATGTCVFLYFVLVADFGEKEHCFMPVRDAAHTDPPRVTH